MRILRNYFTGFEDKAILTQKETGEINNFSKSQFSDLCNSLFLLLPPKLRNAHSFKFQNYFYVFNAKKFQNMYNVQ
mgnify:CR=1 FL=1